MVFIVEDGSGVTGANAYVAIAFVDAYHTDRGNAGWTGTDTVKEQAIIKASDYIDTRFGRKFVGFRQLKDQGLEWPRLDAFDLDGFLLSGIDEVPRQIQKACAEYALRALILTNLLPDPTLQFNDRDTTGTGSTQASGQGTGEVRRKKIKADVIEIDTEYSTLSKATQETNEFRRTGTVDVPSSMIPAYPAADLLIAELTVSSISGDFLRG